MCVVETRQDRGGVEKGVKTQGANRDEIKEQEVPERWKNGYNKKTQQAH